MDWNRAKNLTIIFLFILNIFLGVLLYINSTKYVLTSAQQQSILNVLSRNNIFLYTQIIKEYSPMKNLVLHDNSTDSIELLNLLFDNQTDIKRTDNNNSTIFSNKNESVILNSNSFVYENNTFKEQLNILNINEIRNYANEYIKIFDTFIPDLFLDNIVYDDNEIILQYRQKYKNNIIQNNYIILYITENGINKVEGNYNKPIEFQDDENKLCSPDEALFILIQYLNTIFGDTKIFINKMDIVYFNSNAIFNEESIIAIPYYRFNISESDEYFLVNALTCSIHEIE